MYERETTDHDDRHRHGAGAGIWVGIAFVLFGILLILQTMGIACFHNWWALFIMIPALASLGAAWVAYRRSGRFSQAVAGSITGGLMMGAVAVIFLLSLPWGKVWPVFIVLVGLSIVLNAVAGRS
jgi:hypothetical protein